jgi:hypothetical protein
MKCQASSKGAGKAAIQIGFEIHRAGLAECYREKFAAGPHSMARRHNMLKKLGGWTGISLAISVELKLDGHVSRKQSTVIKKYLQRKKTQENTHAGARLSLRLAS